jgi:hypothetical protein
MTEFGLRKMQELAVNVCSFIFAGTLRWNCKAKRNQQNTD